MPPRRSGSSRSIPSMRSTQRIRQSTWPAACDGSCCRATRRRRPHQGLLLLKGALEVLEAIAVRRFHHGLSSAATGTPRGPARERSEMRVKRRIARLLIQEMIADADEPTREIVLVIHGAGGRHSEVRIPRPKPGEHRHRTGPDAEGVARRMAGAWPDHEIAACLYRLRLRGGRQHVDGLARPVPAQTAASRGQRRGPREAQAHVAGPIARGCRLSLRWTRYLRSPGVVRS